MQHHIRQAVVRCRQARAAQQSGEAGFQPNQGNRLDDIAIGAGIQCLCHGLGTIPRRDHQHRHRGAATSQVGDKTDAIPIRQAEVEQHTVKARQGQRFLSRSQVWRQIHHMSPPGKRRAQGRPKICVVLDKQQPHGKGSPQKEGGSKRLPAAGAVVPVDIECLQPGRCKAPSSLREREET